MRRLLLQQDIERYRQALANERSEPLRQLLACLLSKAERDLALCLEGPFGAAEFRRQFEQADMPSMLLDAREGVHIIDMNEPYATATLVNRNRTAGQPLFEVFPDNPDVPDANGVSKLRSSLLQVVRSGAPHAMSVQRYDVRNEQGAFEERYWRPHNIPVFNADGTLVFILHQAVNVTAQILNRSYR